MQSQSFFINEYAHEFNNSNGRMSIVKLDSDFSREHVELIFVGLLEASDDIAHGCSTEKVLLLDDVLLHFLGDDHVFIE